MTKIKIFMQSTVIPLTGAVQHTAPSKNLFMQFTELHL